MQLSPQQVDHLAKGDKEIAGVLHALLARNQQLIDRVEEQANEIRELKLQVHELKRQLGQNSTNSSKPPSSDGPRKPMNSRQSGGKKGAPKGHPGQTLLFSNKPDEIRVHPVSTCTRCAGSLESVPSTSYEKRQVFDLPPLNRSDYRASRRG